MILHFFLLRTGSFLREVEEILPVKKSKGKENSRNERVNSQAKNDIREIHDHVLREINSKNENIPAYKKNFFFSLVSLIK